MAIQRELPGYIRERGIVPQQLELLLGNHQADVSNLLNGRLWKCSIAKLIKFADMMNLARK